jgi:hypothetical protein
MQIPNRGAGGQTMVALKHFQVSRIIPILIAACFLTLPVQAKYGGGRGEPNDPYQIATAADLIAIGETPEDYDKHFILTADIDLDPNLPGGHVFERAVIANFSGVFHGKGHVVRNLDVNAPMGDFVGLFGQVGRDGKVQNLGTADAKIAGAQSVGGLVGANFGVLSHCWSTGAVTGTGTWVGGLVGMNSYGVVACSYSAGSVSGRAAGLTPTEVGGLVGYNNRGAVSDCYSTVTVSKTDEDLHSASAAGGLIGFDEDGAVTSCYSAGRVDGLGVYVGGLVGSSSGGSIVTTSFWDTKTSGQTRSAGGTGKTTAEMQTASTFLDAGWDFVGETVNGSEDIWKIAEGVGYPRLAWQKYSGGTGEPNDPYQIATAADLIALGETPEDYDKHFILTDDIDLDPNVPDSRVFDRAVIAPDMNEIEDDFQGTPFTGVFDGNEHTISCLSIEGSSYLGLFGRSGSPATISNLGMEAVDVSGTGDYVGALVGANREGSITNCYSTGTVSGDWEAGGLVGSNREGSITNCYSTGTVNGNWYVGGLVGLNGFSGSVTNCYSTGTVDGTGNRAGGLVGLNYGDITNCYSAGTVDGDDYVGGLVGENVEYGGISWGSITSCFWDVETSGQTTSDGGTGKTTAEMQTAATFIAEGWDFVGETVNGAEDIWWIDEGKDYPRLRWELTPEN